jgi:GMP synthase-like glutamine amidotransferase
MNVLVLQHIACEPPGAFEDVLLERDARIVRVELDEGEALPRSLAGVDAVVLMGGPMSVNDAGEHPWLVDEKAFIREAVSGGLPVWGSCLGAQLLASALGARVLPGAAPEVGVLPIHPTRAGRADAVMGPCQWPLTTLQWHSDTFELPSGAVLLASSDAYPHQAFRVGTTVYGVQFHIEVDAALADEWGRVPEYVASAEEVLGDGGAARLLGEVRSAAPEMLTQARALFGRWVDLWAPTPSDARKSAAAAAPDARFTA